MQYISFYYLTDQQHYPASTATKFEFLPFYARLQS